MGRTEMLEMLKKLVTDLKKHIIFSSHILHDIETICEDVVILNEGQVIKQGNLHELMHIHNPDVVIRIRGDQNAFTNALKRKGLKFIVRRNDIAVQNTKNTMENILKSAVETKTQLRHLDFSTSSLEDLFIEIVERDSAEDEVKVTSY
jgi:ABC-2 type transport system ATP-binding protein